MPVEQEYGKQRRYSAKKSLLKSDIHPIPKVVNRERRNKCEHDLKLFLETYCKEAFPLEWAPFHLEVIKGIERAMVDGGNQAIALPRGSGKTTLIVRAALWALLYGKSKYVMIVAADADKAKKQLKTIKQILRMNQKLFEDFPEVCHPIRELQGQAINANKQHCDGEYTLIDWRDKTAQFPTIKGSVSSGAIVEVAGVTAAARGAQTTLADGTVLRPTLVLIDDFQTRESAASEMQCNTRLEIIAGDLAGMKGPDQPLAMLAAITVIYKGDAADRLLDRELNPEWRGIRHKMVNSWPDNEAIWEKYAELRLEAIKNEQPPVEAIKMYQENREEMDRGSETSWEARIETDISAIQHAYHLRFRIGEEAFNAEYQNDPDDPADIGLNFLDAEGLASKVNGRGKGEIPEEYEKITAAIDVQSNHLWFAIVGWGAGFTGTVLDYGSWPSAKRRFYTKKTMPHHFGNTPEYAGMGEEAAILHAISTLLEDITSRRWKTDAGTELSVDRILVDEGYQTSTVHQAIRKFGQLSLISPARGVGIKAGSPAMREWPVRKGEPKPRNPHWRHRITKSADRRLRTTQWDSYYWRTILHKRFATPLGDPGSLAFWGKSTVYHRLCAAHLDSQIPKIAENTGSVELVEWTHKTMKPDDDLFDCLSMCAVGASECGITLQGMRKYRTKSATAASKGLTMAEYLAKRKSKK